MTHLKVLHPRIISSCCTMLSFCAATCFNCLLYPSSGSCNTTKIQVACRMSVNGKLPYISLTQQSVYGGYLRLNMREDPKIPGIVKEIYLKQLYKFETLVLFRELPLRLDAVIPAPLPLLETLSDIFNGNAVEGCQRSCWTAVSAKFLPFG